jgi:hypothetical protein
MARQRVYRVWSRRARQRPSLVQGSKVFLGEEGQAGQGQVLVGLGDGEADRSFGESSVRVMDATIANRPRRQPSAQGLWISLGHLSQGTRPGADLPC